MKRETYRDGRSPERLHSVLYRKAREQQNRRLTREEFQTLAERDVDVQEFVADLEREMTWPGWRQHWVN